MKSFFKFLLFLIFFAAFSASVIYAFIFSSKILKDKKSSIEIEEGKYILMRLLEYNEEILAQKNLDLQREKEELLKQKNIINDDNKKEEIEKKLREIETRQKNIKEEFQKNENEKKTYESNLNNIKAELEQKKLEATRLSKEKLELKLQIENLIKTNQDLKNSNVIIGENEELKNKIKEYEKQITDSKKYWETYTIYIKNYLQNKDKKTEKIIDTSFAKENGKEFIVTQFEKLYVAIESEKTDNTKILEKLNERSNEIAKLQKEIKDLTAKSQNNTNYWNSYVKDIKNILILNNLDKKSEIEKSFSKNNGKETVIKEYDNLYSALENLNKKLKFNKDHNDKLILENFNLRDKIISLNKENNLLSSKISDINKELTVGKKEYDNLVGEIADLKNALSDMEKNPKVETTVDNKALEEMKNYWDNYVSNIKTVMKNTYSDDETKKKQIEKGFSINNGNEFILEEYSRLISELSTVNSEINNLKNAESNEEKNKIIEMEKEKKDLTGKLNFLFNISNVNGFFILKDGEDLAKVVLNENKTNEIFKKGTFIVNKASNGEKYTRIEIRKLADGTIKVVELPGFSYPKNGDWF